jgi:DNA-binding IscR family transcriptional regulator
VRWQRCLGDLRSADLVCVRHGAGAGWSLARAPEEITLLEVHDAVGQEPPFGLHHTERNELAVVSVADVLRETLEVPQ